MEKCEMSEGREGELSLSEGRLEARPGISALLAFGLHPVALAITLPLIFPSLSPEVGWEKEDTEIPRCLESQTSKVVMTSSAPFFLPPNFH